MPVTKTILIRTVTVIVMLVGALLLVRFQILNTQMLREKRVSLDNYIDGEAHRPFAFRALIPLTLRAVNAVTPPSEVQVFDRWGLWIASLAPLRSDAANSDVTADVRSGPKNKYPCAIFWLAVIQFTCLIGYALVGSSLYRCLYPGTRWRPLVAPLLLLLLVVILQQGFGHIYDFAVLFLMASLLRLMVSERHILYLLVFSVSCFNKETTVLMSVAYAAVFFRRMPMPRYIYMLSAQGAIFLLIYMSLRAVFADNPGADVEVWIQHQLEYYLRRPPAYYVIVATAAFILTFRWNEQPLFLRRSMVMIVPHLMLWLYGANPGELRAWYDSMPLLSMFLVRNAEFITEQWWVPRST
jgi:hypothetical protein